MPQLFKIGFLKTTASLVMLTTLFGAAAYAGQSEFAAANTDVSGFSDSCRTNVDEGVIKLGGTATPDRAHKLCACLGEILKESPNLYENLSLVITIYDAKERVDAMSPDTLEAVNVCQRKYDAENSN